MFGIDVAVSISLTFFSGEKATCPAPVPKADLTFCNNDSQVCISGVSLCLLYNVQLSIVFGQTAFAETNNERLKIYEK